MEGLDAEAAPPLFPADPSVVVSAASSLIVSASEPSTGGLGVPLAAAGFSFSAVAEAAWPDSTELVGDDSADLGGPATELGVSAFIFSMGTKKEAT